MSEGVMVDQGLLRQVDQNVRVAISNIGVVSGQVGVVQADLAVAQERIKQLRAFVEEMRREQKNAAALQRAITEIIRIRQELAQKYGKYQEVRDTMIGILQANDTKLVTTSTISRVSEELMISTPKYWLAPCVIALAAWIANDQALAGRAIEEALNRDPEKTALLMALVCRRNGRLETCKDWLTLYFEAQNPNNISRSVLIFVNAYANGVFGPSDKRCDDFIEHKWLPDLEKKSLENGIDFAGDQKRTWLGIFNATMQQSGTPTADKYKYLAKYSDPQDFANVAAYVDRIDITDFITTYFEGIINQQVNVDALKAQIDDYLMALVKDFDDVERNLREEEEKFQIIKDLEGDVDVANVRLAKEKQKKAKLAEQVSLIDYLNEAIRGANDEEQNRDQSEKKTALKFTKSYIQQSYDQFVEEKRPSFPQAIKAKVENVTYTVRTPDDKQKFADNIRNSLESARAAALKRAPKALVIVGAILLAISLIFMIIGFAGQDLQGLGVFGIIILIVGIILFFVGLGKMSKYKKKTNADFDLRIKNAVATAANIVDEWLRVNNEVYEFQSKERFDITTKI